LPGSSANGLVRVTGVATPAPAATAGPEAARVQAAAFVSLPTYVVGQVRTSIDPAVLAVDDEFTSIWVIVIGRVTCRSK